MITPTCYSWRFCARSTYSFSKDDSPANVFEDNRMIWLTLRFLKSKKYHHFFFSRIGRMKFLPWKSATARQIYQFRIFFHVFLFGLVLASFCKRGNPRQKMFEFIKQFHNIVRIFAQWKSKARGCPYPSISTRMTSINYTRTSSSSELTNPHKMSPKSIQNWTVHDVALTLCFVT